MDIFTDYSELRQLFPTYSLFEEAVLGYIESIEVIGLNALDEEAVTYSLVSIYNYFTTDKIAYDTKEKFIKRLSTSLLEILPMFSKKYNYYKSLVSANTTEDEFNKTSSLKSTSSENGKSGSNVVQKSAMTPTGISDTGTNIQSVQLTTEGEKLTLDAPTTNYVDKATNYEGKTSGVHKNETDRNSSMQRSGSTEELFKLFNKLPKSLALEIEQVASKHFIFLYD